LGVGLWVAVLLELGRGSVTKAWQVVLVRHGVDEDGMLGDGSVTAGGVVVEAVVEVVERGLEDLGVLLDVDDLLFGARLLCHVSECRDGRVPLEAQHIP
jgi:hypothetical protein